MDFIRVVKGGGNNTKRFHQILRVRCSVAGLTDGMYAVLPV